MKTVKKQLKRIIHEASFNSTGIIDLASRSEGVSLDEINDLFGQMGFNIIDELTEDNILWLDDTEGIVYATGTVPGTCPSPGLAAAVNHYTSR